MQREVDKQTDSHMKRNIYKERKGKRGREIKTDIQTKGYEREREDKEESQTEGQESGCQTTEEGGMKRAI